VQKIIVGAVMMLRCALRELFSFDRLVSLQEAELKREFLSFSSASFSLYSLYFLIFLFISYLLNFIRSHFRKSLLYLEKRSRDQNCIIT